MQESQFQSLSQEDPLEKGHNWATNTFTHFYYKLNKYLSTLQKICNWSPDSQCDDFWRQGLWDVNRARLGHEVVSLMIVLVALWDEEEISLSLCLPCFSSLCSKERSCEDTVRGGHLQAGKRVLLHQKPNWHIDLGLTVYRTARSKFLLFKLLRSV